MNQVKSNMITRLRTVASLALGMCLLASSSFAAQGTGSLSITPTITNIQLVNGQLLASGLATATVHGQTFTAPFSGIPVSLSVAPGQTNAPGTCPVLSLTLAPINLDLLGLVVQTSAICLDITAVQGGGLLGNLLCNISGLLNQGLSLGQVLSLLNVGDLNALTSGLTALLNGALGNLLQAILQNLTPGTTPGECAILDLTLGPLNLSLLGLVVNLDNCNNGPVTVNITAQHGGLLGNLLCSLAARGRLPLGSLLSDILNGLLNTGPL